MVTWNSLHLTTTFVSSGRLSAVIPAPELAHQNIAQVAVAHPGHGNTSDPFAFTVYRGTLLQLGTSRPSRTIGGIIRVPITIKNAGPVAAAQLTITSALLGNRQMTLNLPIHPALPVGETVTRTLTYPGNVGPPATLKTLTISGSYLPHGGTVGTGYAVSAEVRLP